MFNEANSVENFIRDILCGKQSGQSTSSEVSQLREAAAPHIADTGNSADLELTGLGWKYIPSSQLPRKETDVLVLPYLREALARLNPEIASQPERAGEVIHQLNAIIQGVQGDGLVKANELFTDWLRGEKSMPFGLNNQHVPVRLIDYDNLANNHYIVSTQLTYRSPEKRFDLVLLVNGIPLVVGEAKTPVRPAVSWVDGAVDIHDDYEKSVPAFFVPNVFSFATEGKTFRYGSIRMDLQSWANWRIASKSGQANATGQGQSGLLEVKAAASGLLRPEVVLDILRNFTIFATDKKYRKIKVICRYQQYEAANQIVERVVAGQIKKGLVWHFQGSGKSLLMVFAAQKLRLHHALRNPTVLIVVDRIDLDTQISATFNAADVPNTVPADTREKLQNLLAQDARKVIITTIHKFGEISGVLNTRSNIIVLVDEAHRTQEGDLGRKMRNALPNAFLFGLTGTPINKRDRNTFWAFGATEDNNGYLNRYSFEESIRDGATLPLHFEPRLLQLHVDRATIDAGYEELTGDITEADKVELATQAVNMGIVVKAPERIRGIVADLVEHYQNKIEPNGFKAQLVVYDREACVMYKNELNRLLPNEASAIVMTVSASESSYQQYSRPKDEEERLLDQFRDPAHPLKILIVTSKLLTGFDAPILQVMYLDKPMKEHNLLQAICRVNRPYPGKTHGLIVDYLGVFDDVAAALNFDDKAVQEVISNLTELKEKLLGTVEKCLAYFEGVDRTVDGYEGLVLAQQRLPDNATRDAYAADYSILSQLWEALSPDESLLPHINDYRWLSQVYESAKPPSGHGKLIWHALGAKTVELIHQNIHVEAIRDDLETLVMDANFLAEIASGQETQKAREIELKIMARLRQHKNNPVFVELGLRVERLREQMEQGLISNIMQIKQLLEIARRIIEAEKATNPIEQLDKGKAALTELFNEVRNQNTPIIVERIVADIDEIVRHVRFPGWQKTNQGEREVKKALRQTLLKYKLHKEQDIFDRAYAYIEQYY